jgi:hypothetical protein
MRLERKTEAGSKRQSASTLPAQQATKSRSMASEIVAQQVVLQPEPGAFPMLA